MTDQTGILVTTLIHLLKPAAKDQRVELSELYAAYVRAVTEAGKEAMPPAPFTEIVQGHCRTLGITALLSGDNVFLEGVQLAALGERRHE
jgi:hypothetical protein